MSKFTKCHSMITSIGEWRHFWDTIYPNKSQNPNLRWLENLISSHLSTIEHFQEEREIFETINYILKFSNFLWWFQVRAKVGILGHKLNQWKSKPNFEMARKLEWQPQIHYKTLTGRKNNIWDNELYLEVCKFSFDEPKYRSKATFWDTN